MVVDRRVAIKEFSFAGVEITLEAIFFFFDKLCVVLSSLFKLIMAWPASSVIDFVADIAYSESHYWPLIFTLLYFIEPHVDVVFIN